MTGNSQMLKYEVCGWVLIFPQLQWIIPNYYSHQALGTSHFIILKKNIFFFIVSVKQGSPVDAELHLLAQKLALDWKRVGRRLKIDEAKITKFHEGIQELDEKAYQMLLHWKQRDGLTATYQVLSDALCHKLVNRRDLAEEFCYA